ncbi:hypothetical protein [Flavobacterium cerinum]|uniref:Signal peptidase n=1 Tax=Flavobacterium cerinum TaxID=2502784 RepID=A0ABY5IVT7_9FLAO|nr:hypothetical protein [Flavobacterium cerinum]UUC45632.1 hypothetical protein NOX80_00090 [Flavobacterium cerinum]
MSLLQKKKWFIIILLFSYVSSFAAFMVDETSPNDPPGDSDPEPVPIDNHTLLLVIAALFLGYFLIRKYYYRKANNV